MSIVLVGRFPPPIDGQTLATKRLATLLDSTYHLTCIDTQPSRWEAREAEGMTLERMLHFLRLRSTIERTVRGSGARVALWPAISPDAPGHLRDRLAVLPALSNIRDVVAIVHRGNFEKLFTSRLTSRSARREVDRLSRVVFLSEQLSARCDRWIPPEKRCVIPNTIDDSVLFSQEEVARKQAAVSERTPVRLLFVGNMIAEKGYLDVLNAAAVLRERGVAFRLRFAGRWIREQDKMYFHECVLRHGLRDEVKHAGPVEDRQVIKSFYRDADVVLLPSYYPNEAQPLVILEALNAGIPVIATHHGGIPEIIENGRQGYLVSPRDPAALAEHIRMAADRDRWHELSSGARSRFESTYSPDAVKRQWTDLIERFRIDRPVGARESHNNHRDRP